MLAGIIARPRATSARTNSAVIPPGMFAPNEWPTCWCAREFRISNFEFRIFPDSRIAMYSISGVTIPWRAYESWVTQVPGFARRGLRWNLGFGACLGLGSWDLELPLRCV